MIQFKSKPSLNEIQSSLFQWCQFLSQGDWERGKEMAYGALGSVAEDPSYIEKYIWMYSDPQFTSERVSPPVSNPFDIPEEYDVVSVEHDSSNEKGAVLVYFRIPISDKWSDLRAMFVLEQRSDNGDWEMYLDQFVK